MVSKCVNSECSATFRYFHVGKLYRIETSSGLERRRSMNQDESRPLRRTEFYWLCENCAPKMTLIADPLMGVVARPSARAVSVAAA
jgi:hypothetical protein